MKQTENRLGDLEYQVPVHRGSLSLGLYCKTSNIEKRKEKAGVRPAGLEPRGLPLTGHMPFARLLHFYYPPILLSVKQES